MSEKKTYSDRLKDPRWQKKRLDILSRDEFTCQHCDSKDNTLHVHHISYFGVNPWDAPDRLLITLCEECHSNEEHYLKEIVPSLIKQLKDKGFTSHEFEWLINLFRSDKINANNLDLIICAILLMLDSEKAKSYWINAELQRRKEAKKNVNNITDLF